VNLIFNRNQPPPPRTLASSPLISSPRSPALAPTTCIVRHPRASWPGRCQPPAACRSGRAPPPPPHRVARPQTRPPPSSPASPHASIKGQPLCHRRSFPPPLFSFPWLSRAPTLPPLPLVHFDQSESHHCHHRPPLFGEHRP
jgi:hypothetical protein